MKIKIANADIGSEEVRHVERVSGETMMRCYQCGNCSGGCPVSMKSSLNPRKLVYCYLNDECQGMSAEELGLWECTTCSTCTER